MRPTEHIPEHLAYIRDLYAKEDGLLKEIRLYLEEEDVPIQIGAEEGKLLQLLIRMNRVRTVVEIGTLGGYSALWMARALPEEGQLITIEHDPKRAEVARAHLARSEMAKKITVLEGNAHDLLPTLSTEQPIDMLFIDADKGGYPAYLDWAEAHLRPGALLVADNTLLFGAVYGEKPPHVRPSTVAAMQAFNTRLSDSNYWHSLLLPTAEGLSIAQRVG